MKYQEFIIKLSLMGKRNKRMGRLLRALSRFSENMLSLLSDEQFARYRYKKHTGKKLNLKAPGTYNEKLWWLKYNYRDPLMTRCTDKLAVRGYVRDCGLESILLKLIGVYDSPEDVPLDAFDGEVFIKCNHTSGANVIYDPGRPFDYKSFCSEFGRALKDNFYKRTREWNYKDIAPKIVVEQVLRDPEGKLPLDYKFLCFGGEPKLLVIESGVCDEAGRRNTGADRFVNVYDMNGEFLPVLLGDRMDPSAEVPMPERFEEMKEIARTLSRPFPHCRVDLYCVGGNVYFGEITFFHGGGCIDVKPEEWSEKLGSWIDLENIKVRRQAAL